MAPTSEFLRIARVSARRKTVARALACFAGLSVIAGALLLASPVGEQFFKRIALGGLQSRLRSASDAEAVEILSQISEIDELGLPAVAAALADDRAAVRLAARDLLQRRLDQWRTLSSSDATPRVAKLAETLVAMDSEMGPNARSYAARLAEQMLRWALDREKTNVAILVANCERLLALDSAGQVDRDDGRVVLSAIGADMTPTRKPIRGSETPRVIPPAGNAPLPVAMADPAELATTARGTNTGSPKGPRPVGTLRTDASAGLRPPLSLETEAESGTLRPELIGAERDAIAGLSDPELMRLLQHPQQSWVLAAIEELQRRGFQARHLRIAKRLTDSNVAVRRPLVDELISRDDIDPLPWLGVLALDEEVSVAMSARAAITRYEERQDRPRVRSARR